MRKLAGGWRFVVVMTLLAGVAGTAQAMNWQTVAADTYKLLWKEITYTELQVDGEQAMPAEGDILTPSYAKQIIIRYGLSVSAERFRKLTDDSLADGYSEEELAPHRRAIDTFNSWYLGVEKGDKYRLSWQPDVGVTSLSGTGVSTGHWITTPMNHSYTLVKTSICTGYAFSSQNSV